ncbi:Cytochrome P450 6a2 [Ooceraea biroi]|uniref:Cytochrome P450 6a2 n=2 Tax=Ooceraea biroi TaxID=2015173 RepID=A0A026WV87_OOCBI|nr:Cytochrome P450 6a2 [Ooceraea biroi]
MAAFEILCACLVILLLLYYYVTYEFDYWTSRRVNGPKPVPFFGNTKNFILGKMCMGDVFKSIYDKYPKERMVGAFIRGEPVLVLRDADDIKQVLIKDFTTFPERHSEVYEKAEPMSLHLFRLDAVRWRPLRTQLSPIFTSGKLKDMFHLLLNCSEHFERYLAEMVPIERIVECRNLTSKFTIDVIGTCAFGIEMNALNEENNEFCKMGRKIFRSDLKTLVRNTLKDIPWFYKRIGHIFDDHDITEFMTNITRDTIEYRKKNNVRRHDFVDTLIELKDHPEKLGINNVNDTFIAAQSFVFFAAGFETSSTTIAFAMYELARNHKVQEKLRDEMKQILSSCSNGTISYDDIKKFTYLEQVFRETLRKYPPVMFLSRKAERDYTFESTQLTIRKGLKVFIPVYAIQHDPSIYPDPEVFDPERFNDDNADLKNSMYYLPFGNGPRNCIGARFAVYQVKIGLIKVLMNYKIDVCEKTEIPLTNEPMSAIMLQPRHGVYVKLTRLT